MLASSLGLSVADAKGLKRTFFDAFLKLGRFGEQLKQRCREVLIALDGQCAALSTRGVSTARLIAQVHEGQAADAMMIIKHEMEHVWIAKLRLPVAVTFGPSWAEMAPW
ncbi:hypothetical protein Ctob_015780 [Chrysochromulina tobinii]|uniref:Uncharacterized protein n=1 Tax=Chrysochromulina tobinii TaxID=1460289 RepID=A0A0M0K9A1_9EUKA|nr:hypothetical protein Ctob_015780 [Chrysochromulina tobinii]|eukprot:KOO34948.1 hypothetical protein Ctob_015780 [Chrysochromulina sp. CCMP291]